MIKEIDDLYCYLGRLEEAYCLGILTPRDSGNLAIHEARMKMEAAILNVAVLLTQLISQQESQKKRLC